MFNSKKEIVSLENVFAVVEITEKVNFYNGDIDTKVSVQFNNGKCGEIGTFAVVVRGQYVKPLPYYNSGNGAELWKKHEAEILKEFQLID